MTAERFRLTVVVVAWLVGAPSAAWAQDPFDEAPGTEEISDGGDAGDAEGDASDVAEDEAASPKQGPVEQDGSAPDEPTEPNDERGSGGQGDRAAAESLARVGQGLIELGRYDEACAKLEQSLEAYLLGDAAFLLGECYERLGRLASSWAAYRQAATRYRASGDAKREVALLRASQLEPKVPKLTLLATQRLVGMTIVRDDTEFGVGLLGVPLAMDPGIHRLEVRAEGYEPWGLEIDLKASERRTLEIPPLERAAPEPVTRPDTRGSRGRGPLFYAGVIAAGAGAASVASGVLMAASASRDVSTAESSVDLCGPSRLCTPAGRDLIDRADRKALAATVTLAVGAVAVATGFVLVIVDPGESPAEVGVTLSPLAAPGIGGLTVGGAF